MGGYGKDVHESDRSGITVLVCGGRDYTTRRYLFNTLAEIHLIRPIGLIVCGGAAGADSGGMYWARQQGIDVHVYFPKWELEGKAAGPNRNRRMLRSEKVDVVVACPGGKGTDHMVKLAESSDIQ